MERDRYAIGVNSDTQKWTLEVVCQAIDRGTTAFQSIIKYRNEQYTPADKDLLRALTAGNSNLFIRQWKNWESKAGFILHSSYPGIHPAQAEEIVWQTLCDLLDEIILNGEILNYPHPSAYMNGAIRNKVRYVARDWPEQIRFISLTDALKLGIIEGNTEDKELLQQLPWSVVLPKRDRRSRTLEPPEPSDYGEEGISFLRILGELNIGDIFENGEHWEKYDHTRGLINNITNPRHREIVEYHIYGYQREEIKELLGVHKSTVSRVIATKWLSLWGGNTIEEKKRRIIMKTRRLSDKYFKWEEAGASENELYDMILEDPLTKPLLLQSRIERKDAPDLEKICRRLSWYWIQE